MRAAICSEKWVVLVSKAPQSVEIDTCAVEELERLKDPLGCNHAGSWHDRHVAVRDWNDMATIQLPAAGDGPRPVDDHLRAVLDAMPALVWLAAPDGAAVYIGRRWLGYTGLSAEQAGGWGWNAAVHEDDINRLTTHWQTLLASGAQG